MWHQTTDLLCCEDWLAAQYSRFYIYNISLPFNRGKQNLGWYNYLPWVATTTVDIISINRGFMVRFLLWKMPALYNCHSWCCERLLISTAAETSSISFARSRYSRALLLSLNAQSTALAPGVCKRLCSLGIYDRNQACRLWKRKKRPYRARCRHWGRTGHHQAETDITRCTDKTCSCSPSLTASYLQI